MSSAKTQTPKTPQASAPKSGWYGLGIIGLALLTAIGANVWTWHKQGFSSAAGTALSKSNNDLTALALRSPWTAGLALRGAQILQQAKPDYLSFAVETEPQLQAENPFSLKPNKNSVQKAMAFLQKTALLLLLSFWQWTLKILNILVSIWLLVFAALTGAADGLCQRHVRTAEGGRESTWLYHSATRPLRWCVNLALGLYFIFGIISGTACVLVLSLVIFLIMRVRTSCLKKYL